MSERGSFVTEYVQCTECFEEIKKHLLSSDKFLCSRVIPSWVEGKSDLPIIAGKVGHGGPGMECITIQEALWDCKPCHEVRMVVLSDDGSNVLVRLDPSGDVTFEGCGTARPDGVERV